MSQIEGRADIALDVSNFIALLREDLERNGESQVDDFHAEDFLYEAGDLVLNGREAIRSWAPAHQPLRRACVQRPSHRGHPTRSDF